MQQWFFEFDYGNTIITKKKKTFKYTTELIGSLFEVISFIKITPTFKETGMFVEPDG